jgi:hypothetical protein
MRNCHRIATAAITFLKQKQKAPVTPGAFRPARLPLTRERYFSDPTVKIHLRGPVGVGAKVGHRFGHLLRAKAALIGFRRMTAI